MSSFFKQIFPFMKVKKKKEFSYIIRGVDPYTIWSLVGELGDGSFGKVHKAERKTDGTLAAAKIIDVKDESELDDFMVEIDILSECKHSHVVGMYEAYYHENKLWMMLEFCSGGALDDLILEIERGLTEDQIKVVCRQMFECLHFLHTHKVIHRDLKAGNLLLTSDGNIKLADFGVSAKNKKTVQRRTTFIGTPYWMAPEVIVTETCKDDPYDYKADIWSAGITLIELAEMQPPYHDMHPMRVLFKIPKSDPPQLQAKNKWSKDFHDFLSLCVVKSADMRTSAGQLLEHPFIANVTDNKPLKELYNEAKAVVIEELEDLPEDKEEKEKNELKISESTDSLDESAEWNNEIETDRDEGEKEEEENKETDKDYENEKEMGDKDEKAEEEKETVETKVEEEKSEREQTEERKENDQMKEEEVKDEETVEKKEDLGDKREAESQEKVEEAKEEEEKEDERIESKEKGEEEVAVEEPGKDESKTEEKAEEQKQEEEKSKEEAITASEEIEDKTGDGEGKAEEGEEVEKTGEGESREEVEEDRTGEENEVQEAESKPTDGEKRNDQEGEEIVNSVTEEKEEQDKRKEDEASETVKNEVENKLAPSQDKAAETQVLHDGDKYSARLDNILDNLEEDEREEAQPTVAQKAVSSEETDEVQDSEEVTLPQDKEQVEVEVKKDESDKEIGSGKIEQEKDEEAVKDSAEDNQGEKVETRSEDKEDDVFDVNEKAPMSNGSVIAPALIKEKEPPGFTEKKTETTDGSEEEKSYKTLKRIRKFEKDGKIVTETTSRVVDVSQEDYRNAVIKEQQQRKVNLRELKILQREEQKQGMLLMAKIRRQWDAQEQRFEQELQDLVKKYEVDLDNLSRNQKKEIEKLEVSQNSDLRTSSRKMKQDQEKELKRFRDNLREEHKSAKKEVDGLPRNLRKETWRKKREEIEVSQRQAEHEFLAMQQVNFEKFCKELIELHRERMYNLEMQFLQNKHGLKRGHEGERWEIEQRQLHERHQLARTQLKETFFLQRSQMLNRHQKECEQHSRLTKLKEEEMKRRHEIERKRLPKIQRDEIKAKSQQYRKSIRIDKRMSIDVEREMMKEFESVERKRARTEYEKMLFRQEMEAEELRVSAESALKELQQLQNEKRHMLMESETTKLKERDEKHQSQLAAWKAELGPRKKAVEEEFAREEREQQMFYARNSSEFSISDAKEFDGENQMDGCKTPEDTVSSKSSSGST
ncbi:STE20-like serine/threonine-protein kinase [Acropora millepora]|uniref:STE20-like serine/threonine-protein kinase n=1 Tax=Acropora millepora TaxID=45264 RepID=UPI001CF19CC1|nr:STE20-like serine/threonine-protein kinase [Acropora millepora]